MEKINVEEIVTKYGKYYTEFDGRTYLVGEVDDTEKSLKILANKINELIDVVENKEELNNDSGIVMCDSCNAIRDKNKRFIGWGKFI